MVIYPVPTPILQEPPWIGKAFTKAYCPAPIARASAVVELKSANKFSLNQTYLGKEAQGIEETGNFEWNSEGSKITLEIGDEPMFLVGEGILIKLDKQGNRITGELAKKYILKKTKGNE